MGLNQRKSQVVTAGKQQELYKLIKLVIQSWQERRVICLNPTSWAVFVPSCIKLFF